MDISTEILNLYLILNSLFVTTNTILQTTVYLIDDLRSCNLKNDSWGNGGNQNHHNIGTYRNFNGQTQ